MKANATVKAYQMNHCKNQTRYRTRYAKRILVLAATAIAALLLACSCGKTGAGADWQTCDVALEGGTGKASVQSPAEVQVDGDSITARITWSSSSYDLMVVDGTEYEPVSTEGGSTFQIPIPAFDAPIAVQAQTTAMSMPHMIDYTIRFDSSTLSRPTSNTGADSESNLEDNGTTTLVESFRNTDLGNGWQPAGQVDFAYAKQVTIDAYDNGCKLICMANGERYLVVPEGFDPAQLDGLAEDVELIQQPVSNVYLAATSNLCLVDALGMVDKVGMTSIKAQDCSVESFAKALESGQIEFGGKYNAPDYERIVDKGCTLAIESSMINHNPEVKEKLQELGITVPTELSSYEPEALGRLEWIKLYGAIFNKEAEAEQAFNEQTALCEKASATKTENPSVAFFYINSNGSAVTRMQGDYVAQMIEMAGGSYIFKDSGAKTGANSTVTLEMESFFAQARDADVIIYNATIDGGVQDLNELMAKNQLLGEFKAVKHYDVWCTDANMYQQMTSTGEIVSEMNQIFAGTAPDDMRFFRKLS